MTTLTDLQISHLQSEISFLRHQNAEKEDALKLAHAAQDIVEDEKRDLRAQNEELKMKVAKLSKELSKNKPGPYASASQKSSVNENASNGTLERSLRKQLETTKLDLSQQSLASRKSYENQQGQIKDLQQALQNAQSQLNAALVPKKEVVVPVMMSDPPLSNKDIYLKIKKQRDDYEYDLTIAREEIEQLHQRFRGRSGIKRASMRGETRGTAGPEADVGEASSAAPSATSVPHAASTAPCTPPQPRRKLYGDLQNTPTPSSRNDTTRSVTSAQRMITPREVSSSTPRSEQQRSGSRGVGGFQLMQEGLSKIDKLTDQQLEQLREGLKLKVIMIAGTGYHIVGPFIRRNPARREYAVVEGDAIDDY